VHGRCGPGESQNNEGLLLNWPLFSLCYTITGEQINLKEEYLHIYLLFSNVSVRANSDCPSGL
jgi:hypothetical protein